MKWENRERLMNMSAEDRKLRRQAILKGYMAGKTASQLANEFDCSYQTVYVILRREGYTPHYFGQRDKTTKRFEKGILQLKKLFEEDPPQNDSAGLLSLLVAAREIIRSLD